jgi:proteic killer suppression protein
MEIESIRHKALRNLVEKGRAKGVIEAGRIIDMIAFIVAASGIDELGVPPNFGFHALTGNRRGVYAMTVTRNWRLTFTLTADDAIADLDLEDYH